MITNKVKALFDLIDFLHTNTDNFKQYNSVMNELSDLGNERSKLQPKKNYKDKLKAKDIDVIKNSKIDAIKTNIIEPIKNKALSLKVCDWSMQANVWNWNIIEIYELQENPDLKDVELIQEYKQKYVHYRTETNNDYYCYVFFHDLDRTLYTLFSFFCDNKAKEFNQFSTVIKELEYFEKPIEINEQAPEPQAQAQAHTQTKQGRPKTVIHEASYYLHNKELLQFLIDNYSNTKPQIFNQLLSVLADIEVNQLKPATKKEYKEAFGKALNVRQRQSNFDNYFNTIKIDEIFKPIKATIKTYLNGN